MTYDEAVEEALCFGWVDSLGRRLDDERTMLLVTPRRAKSGWSRPNKERIARLEASGLLAPAGAAKIAAARADGSWELLDAVEALEVPPDLAAALAADAGAGAGFAAFAPSVRKPLLQWLVTARRPETRRRRIEEIVRGAGRRAQPAGPAPPGALTAPASPSAPFSTPAGGPLDAPAGGGLHSGSALTSDI